MNCEQNKLDPLFNCVFEKPRTYPKEFLKYRKLWEHCGSKHIVPEFPINLDAELSTDCNLHCGFCMRQQLKRFPKDYMEFRDFGRYINEAVQHKTFSSLKTNYRGESLLHPKIVQFLQFAKERGVMDILINTNGQVPFYLCQRIAPFIDEIAFSVDAFTQETYTKVRPFGSLKRLILNVEEFIRLRDTAYPSLRVRVAFVRQKHNHKETEDFIKFWTEKDVDKIIVNEAYSPGGKGDYKGIVKWVQDDDFVCSQLFQRLIISPTGQVLPCCGSYDESLCLGNIKREKKTIKDYWLGDGMEGLRDLHLNHMYKSILTCSKCALTFRPEKVEE